MSKNKKNTPEQNEILRKACFDMLDIDYRKPNGKRLTIDESITVLRELNHVDEKRKKEFVFTMTPEQSESLTSIFKEECKKKG